MKLSLDKDVSEENIVLRLTQNTEDVTLNAHSDKGHVKSLITFKKNGKIILHAGASIGNFKFDKDGYMEIEKLDLFSDIIGDC